MNLLDEHFESFDRSSASPVNLAIDRFFVSLAQERKENAIAVILSGTGSDGSKSIFDIKENAGLVFVQSPDTAAFDAMPKAAIETGLVDVVASPEEIGGKLSKLLLERSKPEEKQELSTDITALIYQYCGVDFSQYKNTTIQRRIRRRMSLHDISTFPEYYKLLKESEEERRMLYGDFLISVTHFIRDREAFQVLNDRVIAELWADPVSYEQIRIWVTACATGEEAYSLAILCAEQARLTGVKRDVKIFATDICEAALVVAGKGIYNYDDISDLDPDLVGRYFEERPESKYKVCQEVRDLITFARHDALNDPPFAQLSLITCRNFLIYLAPDTQRRLINTLHYSIWPKGYLFLGLTETLGEESGKFEIIDSRWKIFRCRSDVPRSPENLHFRTRPTVWRPLITEIATPKVMADTKSSHVNAVQIERLFLESLLQREQAAAVVVDHYRKIVYRIGDLTPYVQQGVGFVDVDICSAVDDRITLSLRMALKSVFDGEKDYVSFALSHQDGDLGKAPLSENKTLLVQVSEIKKRQIDGSYALVRFSPTDIPVIAPGEEPTRVDGTDVKAMEEYMSSLERELGMLKHELQGSIESSKSSAEEVQAANEELVMTNEELQSANEELQSLNEELHTVNSELQERVREEVLLTRDLTNVLTNCPTAMILLDCDLKVCRFTPNVVSVFPLRSVDIGRHLSDFSSRFDNINLVRDAQACLTEARSIESIAKSDEGVDYLIRCNGCFGANRQSMGVLISFSDISLITHAQRSEHHSRLLLDYLVGEAPIVIISWEAEPSKPNAKLTYCSDNVNRLLNYASEDLLACRPDLLELIHIDDLVPFKEMLEAGFAYNPLKEPTALSTEVRIMRPDGEYLWVETGVRCTDKGKLVGYLMDCSKRKQVALDYYQASMVATRNEHMATIGTLAGGIAHEFNNLNAITVGTIELALEREEMSEHLRRSLLQVCEVVGRSTKITRDLLYIAKPDVEKSQNYSLNEVIDTALSLLEAQLVRSAVKVGYSKTQDAAIISGWPGDMGRALINLFINSIHAMAECKSPSLDISLSVDSKEAILKVRDNGCGIDPEHIALIFRPFFSTKGAHSGAGSSQQQLRGTGLGLSIVEAIVRKHMGNISVESTLGNETVFTIILPLAGSGVESLPKDERSLSVKDSLRGKRILVAEDEELVRELIASMLSQSGAEVASASNGQEALSILQQSKYDLVILDWLMPSMNGEEFLKEVASQDHNFDTPVIICSGQVTRPFSDLKANPLVVDVILKPFSMSELVAKACNAFRTKEL